MRECVLRRCGPCLCGTCHKRPSRTCPHRLSSRCSVRIPPTSTTEYLECPLPPEVPQTAVHSWRRRAGAVTGAACATPGTVRHITAGRDTCKTLAPKIDRGVGAPEYPRRCPLHVVLAVAGVPRSIKLLYDRVVPGKYSRSRRTNLEEKVGVLAARFVAALCHQIYRQTRWPRRECGVVVSAQQWNGVEMISNGNGVWLATIVAPFNCDRSAPPRPAQPQAHNREAA